MILDAVGLTDALVSQCLALGVFDRVNDHEPQGAPPGSGVTAAVWLDQAQPAQAASGLASVSMRVSFQVRIYIPTPVSLYGAIEQGILDAASKTYNAFAGGFTLGGKVRNVDMFGETGPGMTGAAGFVEVDGRVFRAFTITIPVIINDLYDEVP